MSDSLIARAAVPLTAEAWDPLKEGSDEEFVLAAQKREIRNILKSYTGYYDLFSELMQNALDAAEKRAEEGAPGYHPAIWITIDIPNETVSVTDNGCAMTQSQFRGFLKPNFSFKQGGSARGSKGVGATFLAYGFNYLEIATKPAPDTVYSGVIEHGRTWLDDNANVISRPKVQPAMPTHAPFHQLDRGTSVSLKLTGDGIRPRSIQYFIAKTAEQWMCLLRAHTPLGGIYICGDEPPEIQVALEVIPPEGRGVSTCSRFDRPRYLFPHEVLGRTADLRDFLKDQMARAERSQDLSRVPPRFSNLNGIWGEWSGDEILANRSPVKPKLDDHEKELISQLKLQMYVFMCYSTDLWVDYNDNKLGLRKRSRILTGGLQQATKHMPQGAPITIPLTNNIGFQNITHAIVQFQNAEPDLGRKGFQPELTTLAEKLSVSAVTAFRHHYDRLLRRNTGAPALMQAMRLEQWIEEQKDHEKVHPLVIRGKGLFAPEEELPIRSLPLVEQDVVALFNQMLSSGLIRGIQLLSSSQYKQYDGLYRIRMDLPFLKFIRSPENPLGIEPEHFSGVDEAIISPVRVLEYKYSLNALMEELDTGYKNGNEIGLAVCWELGDKWRAAFDIISYLDDENVHHREFHGITHALSHGVSGLPAFQLIVLKDLISYLLDPMSESECQRQLYSIEPEV
ncbi:MAG: ATP-binding protein [Planctomycetota bacterium]